MQIAICDDEKNIRDWLANKIHKTYPDADILFYASGEELLATNQQIDIIFLDIKMQGKNGMETAIEFRQTEKQAILIFVTGIEDYVFQSFDVDAFHYLLKPIDENKLEEVLKKAVAKMHIQNQKTQKAEEKYIVVKQGGVHTKVLLDDIVYAEVFNRKVVIHKLDCDIEYYGKMADLEKAAGEDFFRTHRAYLVHFKYVEKYTAKMVYLEKGAAIMAKQNYAAFVKRYMKYNANFACED